MMFWFVAGVLTFLSMLHVHGFNVPAVDFPTSCGKLEFSQAELDYLKFNLELYGIIAFTNIPGFKEARSSALLALGECYQQGKLLPEASFEVKLADGTKRTTLANDQGDEHVNCVGLAAKMNALQDIVHQASAVFARALDQSVLIKEAVPLLMAVGNAKLNSYANFSSVVEHGKHLDHFHVYEKPAVNEESAQQAALEKHADQGLFIAIAPSITLYENGAVVFQENDGFEIELSQGKLESVKFPNEGNALVFMVGDGMTNWIARNAVRRPLRPVPHRLVLHSKPAHTQTRLWFGRMFFPPADAFLPQQQTTFAKVRQLSSAADSVDFVGCSNQRHVLRDLTESACAADEIYCWMTCMSTAELDCSNAASIECINPNTQQIWHGDQDSHCLECVPQCYGDAPPAFNEEGICNPNIAPTNMYMSGFTGLGPRLNCLVFLFPTWTLDTEVKYAFGSLGAFLVAFTVESMILLRRQLQMKKDSRAYGALQCLPDGETHPRIQALLLITCYAVQLVFAYFAMLLAMSFATIVFVMIMLGFVVGHVAFNFELPPKGNEACCNVSEPLLTGNNNNSPMQATSSATVPSTSHTPNCCQGDGVETA